MAEKFPPAPERRLVLEVTNPSPFISLIFSLGIAGISSCIEGLSRGDGGGRDFSGVRDIGACREIPARNTAARIVNIKGIRPCILLREAREIALLGGKGEAARFFRGLGFVRVGC